MFSNTKKPIFGMIHLGTLPGTPMDDRRDFSKTLELAIKDALTLESGGANGCVVQNSGDKIYNLERTDPIIIAAMTKIISGIREAVGEDFRIGILVMRNDLIGSLAIAKIGSADFVRCPALVGTTMSASGIIQSQNYEVLSYRRKISADDIHLVAEVYSTHFKWITGDQDVTGVANMAISAGASALSLCDPNEEKCINMIRVIKNKIPKSNIIVSGYTNHSNVSKYAEVADGLIVGGCIEKEGKIQENLLRDYVDIVRSSE